jgi:hypothetical protein
LVPAGLVLPGAPMVEYEDLWMRKAAWEPDPSPEEEAKAP